MKKLLIFLMIAIPLVVILVVNLTVNVVAGMVSVSVDSISLSMDEIRAQIEETITLEAIVMPKNATNKDVIWQSTNEDVAIVDLNGNVSFVGFGNGYITATTVDGNKRASCYFYITDTEVHEVTISSAEAQNGNYFVGLGGTLQLSAVVLPVEAIEKDVRFTSENEQIATVDSNGLVTGLAEGKVKITVTSESKPEISDYVIVEVVKPVEEVVVTTERAVTSSDSYQISYNIYPTDASVNSVTYLSSDEEIATVSPSGLVTFLKPGVVVIELTTVEGQKTAQIQVEYTNGYASDLILDVQTIERSINDGGMYIGYYTIPQSVDVDVEFSSDDENVAYVDDSGYVQFMGGGNTVIRARIKKNRNEWIEKVISVYIESPATDIILEDSYLVATKEFKLVPQSYPLSSTNDDYYFFSNDTSKATVDEKGIVTFLRDEYLSVQIDVYANKEKNVKKTVTLTYTNGYATDLLADEETIQLNYGEHSQINYSTYPENIDQEKADVKFKVLSQTGNNGNDVIEVLDDGSVKTLGGGEALVEISCLKYNGTRIFKNVKVLVNRKVEDVQFEADLDFVDGEYVTGTQTIQFNIFSKTLDATNTKVLWELKNNQAIKSGASEITFNNAGLAHLRVYSEDGNAESTIYIRYTKSNILSASVSEIPQTIDVGQTIEVNVLSIVPANGNSSLSIKVNNQTTSSELGKVIEIVDKTKIKAVAGGNATITVHVANLQYVYNIKTIKKAEQVLVTPANITTTKDKIILQAEVLPVDASDKEVVYEVINEDVAQISGNTIIFKKDGIANIKVTAVDGSGVSFAFTIEKVAKGAGDVSINGEAIKMQVNEENIINLSSVDFDYETKEFVIRSQNPIVENENVISIEDDKIKAISLGNAFIDCILTNEYGGEKIISIEINVVQISEDIEFNTELDYVSGEYVSASEKVELSFVPLPQFTSNKNYNVRILRFTSSFSDPVAPYIKDSEIIFGSVGTAVVEVSAEDMGATKQFRIKYTGGDAIDAELNIETRKTLDAGETIEIGVNKWIPYNTQNTQIYIREISHSQGVSKVVEISGNTIKAIEGGESRILVELSNGITKDIVITVLTKVKEIVIDDEIISSSGTVLVSPIVYPTNATNKSLVYSMENNDIAYISGKSIVFTKPGSIKLLITTSDGSNISKQVVVTSTFGYVNQIQLNLTEKSINKGGQFTVFAASVLPADATNKQIMFKVIDEKANDGSQNHVVEVNENGLVKGLYGGEATVRVYTLDYYGNEVYSDVRVNVKTAISDFDVKFERELASSHGSFITAKPTLGFSFNIYPADTSNKQIICESSDETIAVIKDDKITFFKNGVVVLKFTAGDTTNGSIFKSISIYYTDGNLVSVEVDETRFAEKELTLNVGEKFKFRATSFMPYDAGDITFTISNKSESRIDSKKPVILFNNSEIEALNGGEISFTLCARNIEIGRYTVKVSRRCESIEVDSNEAFVNSTNYQIVAKALPTDTYQTQLNFTLIRGNGSVDQNGLVTLSGVGVVKVKITSAYNDNISQIVSVEYTNEVKRISFNKTVTQLYYGSRIDLKVIEEPFNVAEYQVVFTSSDESIASVNSFGRVIAKEKAGEVTIRATVVGKENIFTERKFTVIPIVYSISLELDEVDDQVGIGGYRVWGTRFSEDGGYSDKTTNNYQMKIRAIEPAVSNVNLIWYSSDESIATVNENGLVTFIAPGIVTIFVEPEVQYYINRPTRDSYTFIIVEGINIYNDIALNDRLNRNYVLEESIVIQSDLKMAHNFEIRKNLYGNGHLIDFSEANSNGFYDKVIICRDDIMIDNAVLRGATFDKVAAISTLEGQGTIIKIQNDGYKPKNIRIRNSVIENAMICAVVRNAEVEFSGCIVRNSFSAGIVIRREEGTITPPEVRVKDCIFGNSLFSSIMFDIEFNPKNPEYKSMLYVDNVKFYNWVKIDEFSGKFVEEYVTNPSEQLRGHIRNHPEYVYKYNNEEYVLFGILANLDVGVQINGYTAININSCGEVIFEGDNPYNLGSMRGTITDLKLKSFAFGSWLTGDVNIGAYGLLGDTTYITPASTYDDDPNTYPSIRQPFSY